MISHFLNVIFGLIIAFFNIGLLFMAWALFSQNQMSSSEVNSVTLGFVHEIAEFTWNFFVDSTLAEKFIYDGYWPDTGPATVIEAQLCGCEVLTSPVKATILTNNFKDEADIRNRIRMAKKEYWNNLEGVL